VFPSLVVGVARQGHLKPLVARLACRSGGGIGRIGARLPQRAPILVAPEHGLKPAARQLQRPQLLRGRWCRPGPLSPSPANPPPPARGSGPLAPSAGGPAPNQAFVRTLRRGERSSGTKVYQVADGAHCAPAKGPL